MRRSRSRRSAHRPGESTEADGRPTPQRDRRCNAANCHLRGTSCGRVTPEGWPASPDEETDHADDKRGRRTSRQSNEAVLHTVDVIEFEHAGQSEVGWCARIYLCMAARRLALCNRGDFPVGPDCSPPSLASTPRAGSSSGARGEARRWRSATMKLLTEYIEHDLQFERLAAAESDPRLKAQFIQQAKDYRKLAADRAKRYGLPHRALRLRLSKPCCILSGVTEPSRSDPTSSPPAPPNTSLTAPSA
ncbi:hypothetical protein ACVW17_007140 [Bradyrhizobium sp. USDA 4473]